MRSRATVIATLVLLLVIPRPGFEARRAPVDPISCGIDMRNVSLHVADDIVLGVTTLTGELVSLNANAPPTFDDAKSYALRMKTAKVSMSAASLNALMARVFGGNSSVRDLKITVANGEIRQSGKLHKGVGVPFSMKTDVSVTPDGRLRLHATSIKAIGIPIKGMLDLFGVELDNLMKAPGQRGIQIEGDDVLLAPADILPPPKTEGRVKSVQISGDRLVMEMIGDATPSPAPASRPDPSAANYVYFHGGIVRFGKLTMTDADLQLVDTDPRDAFDFFPQKYLQQLVAGYSRTTQRGGLKVMMPDYGDLNTPRGKPAVRPANSGPQAASRELAIPFP